MLIPPLKQSPARADFGRPAARLAVGLSADMARGNQAMLRRVADDASAPAAGAPALVEEEPSEFSTQAGSGTGAAGVVQRQAGGAAAAAPAAAVAATLSWADFAPVPSRRGGMSAQTAYRWRQSAAGFSVAFNPGGSWSVLADQTPALLRHEQYHLNLAVLVANKANAAAAAGTLTGAALVSAFRTTLDVLERNYDSDTDHSRNISLQTAWEQDIDAGVPAFPMTP